MSETSIRNIGSVDSFAQSLIEHHLLPRVLFVRKCSRMSGIFFHQKVVNLCISDTLNPWSRDLNTDFTFGNFLFRAVIN